MYSSVTPLQVITDLAIDDGVPSRGHRVNIFKSAYAYVGIWTGKHKTYRTQTCLDYSGSNTQLAYSGPTLPIPDSYMAYTEYASPDTAPGAGGSSGKGGDVDDAAVSKYQLCYPILLLLFSYFN